MILRRLHLVNFKSIAAASCTFSPKVNCLIGLNGMGKTNLLDALHYLAFTKSHLPITDSLAVRRGAESAVLEGSDSSSCRSVPGSARSSSATARSTVASVSISVPSPWSSSPRRTIS